MRNGINHSMSRGGFFSSTKSALLASLIAVVFTASACEFESYEDDITPGRQASLQSGVQEGLLGSYFNNADFTDPVFDRVDAMVDFNWGSGSPDPKVGSNSFSVRWSGFVTPEYSETYTFYTVSDDGVKLWVNDELVVSDWSDHAPRERSGEISLKAGVSYSVKIEYYENAGGAVAKLLWSSPSRAKQIIPKERLSSGAASEETRTCARADENKKATLVCADGAVIESIDFASYGLPAGSCEEGFEVGTCHASTSTAQVEKECLNQETCTVSASNGIFGDPCPGTYKNLAIVYTCTTATPAEALITASGENTRVGETKDKAFDGQPRTKWLTFTDAAWIQYDFAGDTKKAVMKYTITSANDAPERDPRDWRLLGSNDGVDFTTLDERSGEIFSARFQKKAYDVENPAAFKMYRLDILSNFNPPKANSTQLAEIELLEDGKVDLCPDDDSKTEPGICGCGVSDADSDGDGTVDCQDSCPADSAKTEPGICGCGATDEDSDGDGAADCDDLCPDDPNKTEPGEFGCGETGSTELPLTPFDANTTDLAPPSGWRNRYGKTPEIVVASDGVELDVLAQDYDATTAHTAVLIHIAPTGDGYEVIEVNTALPMLDRVMGLAVDESGNRYYATGVDENGAVNSEYPALDTWRSDIVRVVKVDPSGAVLFNIDLDTARHDFNSNAEPIINPMVAATARLAVGGNEVALVHGINTDPDWNIGGVRHQKALSTRLDATTGAVTRASSIWVSHSFDQRLLYDGSGIIEMHLGDAYPRQIVMGKDHRSYPLFHIKGSLGANETRTRLGNMALIEGDPTYGYIALFSAENTAETSAVISGPRNLAIVRVGALDGSIDPSLPDTLTVTSSGKERTNRLRWITDYTSESGLHAERPKLIGIGDNAYIVLWEEWTTDGPVGVMAMVIDDRGDELVAPTLITVDDHLHRGDDAFELGGRAGWMTGSPTAGGLYLHLVDESLGYEIFAL